MHQLFFLLWQQSKRDIAIRYRGSSAGLLWALLSPILLLLIYTFVFGVVFQARWGEQSASQSSFALYLFAGLIIHGFFAECLTRSTSILLQHANYIKRIVYPLAVLPLVPVCTALFHAAISFTVFFAALWILQGFVSFHFLLLPAILLPLLAMTAGACWLIASLSVFLRDIGQIMPMLTTVLLFTAPIFYPVSALPPAFQDWMLLNPLTTPIEMTRNLLFSAQLPSPGSYLLSLLAGVLVAAFGLLVFSRLRPGFADAL